MKKSKKYNLTSDKSYETIHENDEFYTVINDKGFAGNYKKELFEVIPEFSFNTNNGILTINGQSFGEIREILITSSTNISCGINQWSGIDGLISCINEEISEEDTIAILKACFRQLISNQLNISMLLMSTTVSGDNHLVTEALSDWEVITQTGRNGNSGNDIILWVIKLR
jgi:hypothetical protein